MVLYQKKKDIILIMSSLVQKGQTKHSSLYTNWLMQVVFQQNVKQILPVRGITSKG